MDSHLYVNHDIFDMFRSFQCKQKSHGSHRWTIWTARVSLIFWDLHVILSIYSDFMVIYSDFTVTLWWFYGDSWWCYSVVMGFNGIQFYLPSGKCLRKTMERSTMLFMGKLAIFMAIFNIYVSHYQRVQYRYSIYTHKHKLNLRYYPKLFLVVLNSLYHGNPNHYVSIVF